MLARSNQRERQRAEAGTYVAAPLVTELFAMSPPSWIRPALTLTGLGAPQQNPSFELGCPRRDEQGAVTLSLAWWPDKGTSTFSHFEGRVVIEARAGGTVVRLEGTAEGGESKENRATLEGVLRRLVRAVEDAYPVSTR